ncbi:LysR family transcriptional regulator [Micromonospora sp. KC213]|uniref:LysR family transcriptional regulator n=1 Tax=Micromonospora sp. KC213 TaxID=2530378 RepID=UPI001052EA1C|nr:LysR family transcriptional regulator [Micromonospora sp. KC213]TDC43788.1 LysR family transcriptional regulator [Micromonospora sp. KC213]
MDVDLRDLELLEALDRHTTLTAAAQHLYLSQPALSQRLIRLEERLGTPLFERRGRRLIANRAGQRMLRAAHSALAEVRAATHEICRSSAGRTRPVRLASQCAGTYQWLPPVVRAFRQRMPGVEVLVEHLPDGEVVPALLAGDLDLALACKLDVAMDRLRLQRLFDDELVAVVSTNHPWAGRAVVRAEDFVDVHLLLFDAYDQSRSPAVALPIPARARPARLTTAPITTELLIETIASGDSVSVLPTWTVAPYLTSHGVVTVPIEGAEQHRTWYCATRHGQLPEAVETFAGLLAGSVATYGSEG